MGSARSMPFYDTLLYLGCLLLCFFVCLALMHVGHVSRIVDMDENVGTPLIVFPVCIGIHPMGGQDVDATGVSQCAS